MFRIVVFVFLLSTSTHQAVSQLSDDWKALYGCSNITSAFVANGKVWVRNSDGYTAIDPVLKRVLKRYDQYNTPQEIIRYGTYVDDGENVWVSKDWETDSIGYVVISLSDTSVRSTTAVPGNPYFKSRTFYKNEAWCITDNSIYVLSAHGYQHMVLADIGITGTPKSIASDENLLLVKTDAGMWTFQNGDWSQLQWLPELATYSIETVMSQPDGTIWMIIVGNLTRYRNGEYFNFNSPQGINYNVSDVAFANDTVWFSITHSIFSTWPKKSFGFIIGQSNKSYLFPELSPEMPYTDVKHLVTVNNRLVAVPSACEAVVYKDGRINVIDIPPAPYRFVRKPDADRNGRISIAGSDTYLTGNEDHWHRWGFVCYDAFIASEGTTYLLAESNKLYKIRDEQLVDSVMSPVPFAILYPAPGGGYQTKYAKNLVVDRNGTAWFTYPSLLSNGFVTEPMASIDTGGNILYYADLASSIEKIVLTSGGDMVAGYFKYLYVGTHGAISRIDVGPEIGGYADMISLCADTAGGVLFTKHNGDFYRHNFLQTEWYAPRAFAANSLESAVDLDNSVWTVRGDSVAHLADGTWEYMKLGIPFLSLSHVNIDWLGNKYFWGSDVYIYRKGGPVFHYDNPEIIPPPAFTETRLYPNPAPGNAVLTYTTTTDGLVTIRVCDIPGRIVFLSSQNEPAGVHKKTLENFQPGLYFVELNTTDTRQQFRFVSTE